MVGYVWYGLLVEMRFTYHRTTRGKEYSSSGVRLHASQQPTKTLGKRAAASFMAALLYRKGL